MRKTLTFTAVCLAVLGSAAPAMFGPPPSGQSGTTKLQITEQTQLRENSSKKGFFSGEGKGSASATFNVKVSSATDKIDASTGEAFVYIQFVSYAENLGTTCVEGLPACEHFESYEFVEWWVKELPPNYIEVSPPEALTLTPLKDRFTLSAEGKGCFKLQVAEGFVVMSGHPKYKQIIERLEGHYDEAKEKVEGGPRYYTAPSGEEVKTGCFRAGTSDSNGNNAEDLTESGNEPSTRSLIQDDPTGDHWGSLPFVPDVTGFNAGPLAHHLTLVWNFCQNKRGTPKSGVGL
jgi:hypothetical protein